MSEHWNARVEAGPDTPSWPGRRIFGPDAVAQPRLSAFDPASPPGDGALTVLRDALQRNWTELAFRQELSAYHSSARWKAAGTVLDLGSGSGHYLREIARAFPGKDYTGVDRSRELVDRANIRYTAQNMRFVCAELSEVEERYDAIIMRSLLRQIPGTRGVLDKAAELTGAGGTAFIVEALDSQRHFDPIPRRVVDFLDLHAAHQRRVGKDVAVALNLPSMIRSHPAWELGSIVDIIVPSTLADNLRLFKETYKFTFSAVERSRELDYDYEALAEEWRWWCRLPEPYTHVALRVLRLDRV